MLGVFRELWQHRDLALILGWREIVVRYKRSVLGIAWALAEPLVLVAVYVVVFGVVLDAGRGLANYPLFALSGVLAWTFFSSTLEQCTYTLLEHGPLIKKSYFPREVLLFAVVFSRLTTLLAGLGLTLVAAAIAASRGDPVAWSQLWTLPVGALSLTALATGAGMLLAALQVMLRDIAFLVRFGLRLLFYACPIVYPVLLVPSTLRPLYDLNPLVALLWLFQAPFTPSLPFPSATALASAALAALALPALSWALFRRLQWEVADLL